MELDRVWASSPKRSPLLNGEEANRRGIRLPRPLRWAICSLSIRFFEYLETSQLPSNALRLVKSDDITCSGDIPLEQKRENLKNTKSAEQSCNDLAIIELYIGRRQIGLLSKPDAPKNIQKSLSNGNGKKTISISSKPPFRRLIGAPRMLV